MNKLLLAMLGDAWAIDKAGLDGVIAQSRQFSEQDFSAAVERLKTDSGNRPAPYDVVDGAAVIPVRGTLTKEASIFSVFMGARTYSGIQAQVAAALSDSAVERIVFKIFSPGGIVPGLSELASFLSRANETKPIYTYVDGQATSAAYWIGSVGRKIGAPATAQVGSIGVRAVHVDESKLNDRIGIQVTHLTAGRYKAVGNPDAPLSDADRAYLQERLDTFYTLFVDAVAENRGMTQGAALSAADGKIFLGEEARENGLVDMVVSDFDDFLMQIKNGEDQNMNYEKLKAEHPELFKQVRDEGHAAGKAEAAQAGASADGMDKGRVLEFVGLVAGEDGAKKVQALMDTNLAPSQIKALQGVFGIEEKTPAGQENPGGETPAAQAQAPASAGGETPPAADPDQASRQKILDGINSQGTPPLAAGNNNDSAGGNAPDFNAMVTAYMAEHKCSRSKAIQSVKAQAPEAHEAYLKAANNKA